MLRRHLLVLVASAIALVAACGAGEEAGGPSPPDTEQPTTASSTRPPGANCSAATASAEPSEQEGLPEPVARLRRDIVAAAVACDFERLAELAQAGDRPFTYSFGGGDDPAAHWREGERDPSERGPLRYLAGILDRPYRLVDGAGATRYVWPSAFAFDSWSEVPAADRDALKPLYTETDFEEFARFGSYVGYRVGITPEGDWLFFVAGD